MKSSRFFQKGLKIEITHIVEEFGNTFPATNSIHALSD